MVPHELPRRVGALYAQLKSLHRGANHSQQPPRDETFEAKKAQQLLQIQESASALAAGKLIPWNDFPLSGDYATEFASMFIDNNHLLTIRRRGNPPHNRISLQVGSFSFALDTQVHLGIAPEHDPETACMNWHFTVEENSHGPKRGLYGLDDCQDSVFGVPGEDNYDIAFPLPTDGFVTHADITTNAYPHPLRMTINSLGLCFPNAPSIPQFSAWFYNNLRSK